MKRFPLALASLLGLAVLSLNSCSGPVGGNVPPPPGTANFTLTVTDAPPSGVSFLSFNVPISSVSLTSSTGTVVNVLSPASPIVLDMIRLQSDSAALGTVQIPTDTYTKLNITIGVVNTTFSNNTGATLAGCAVGDVCFFNSGTPGMQTITFASPVTISGSTNVGLNVDFNLNNVVTSAGGLAIDFTQANVLTVSTPQLTGNLNPIEDFTGVVTAVNGSQVTITSGTRGALVGTVNTSTTYHAVNSAICGGTPNANCLSATTKRTVSVDATLAASGAVTITEVDFLDDPSADAVEGVIYPTSTAGVYNMIVSDKVNASNNALLTAVSAGAKIAVTLDTSVQFDVDTRNLLASVPSGFSSSADIFAGQEVMVHVKTATSGTLLNILTDRLVLRYTRSTGTVNTVSGTAFTVNNLPPFLGNNFTLPPAVQTFSGVTAFEGFSALGDLATGNPTVSFRALYLNPNTAPNGQPFLAAKVRKH